MGHGTNPPPSAESTTGNSAMPLLDHRSHLPALALAGSVRGARILSRVVTTLFVFLLVGVIFLPWQQFVSGTGRVVAYNPLERSVTVEAPLPGRVAKAHIVEAASGVRCLTLMQSDTFDVVLMDMFMPGMSGPQTCHAIRHDLPAPLCDVPVIGLTASTHAQDRQLCLDAGMNEVLSKPMDKVRLAAIVNSQLHAAQTAQGSHVN